MNVSDEVSRILSENFMKTNLFVAFVLLATSFAYANVDAWEREIDASTPRATVASPSPSPSPAPAPTSAQVQQTQNGNQAGQQQEPSGEGQRCNGEIQTFIAQKRASTTQVAGQAPAPVADRSAEVKNCVLFRNIANGRLSDERDQKNTLITSSDKKISCKSLGSYTIDYEPCQRAVGTYDMVLVAENALNLTQQVRTDQKNKSLQQTASQQTASGDGQTAMYDAAIASNKHQKAMQQEKALAYGAAVAALVRAYAMIPGQKQAMQKCAVKKQHEPEIPDPEPAKNCEDVVTSNKSLILANQSAKAGLATAIGEFTAKGVAAGIAMGQYNNAAQQVAKAKGAIQDEETDLMMERCQFNPADPACQSAGPRTSNPSVSTGDFSFGGDGMNNAFDPITDPTAGDALADTPIDDKAQVGGVGSPFADDVKTAKGILDPAAAASVSPGSPGGGSGGGGGGGLGGGSASLGGDLQGADKDAEKEAQIKAGKVSGAYGAVGGGGFKGIARGKDDSNPFSSLFDQKGGGGVQEDRSIASGDIDGQASGLFQKISKRYGQVTADKRIEANNLE